MSVLRWYVEPLMGHNPYMGICDVVAVYTLSRIKSGFAMDAFKYWNVCKQQRRHRLLLL
jgi:hypothetical protein